MAEAPDIPPPQRSVWSSPYSCVLEDTTANSSIPFPTPSLVPSVSCRSVILTCWTAVESKSASVASTQPVSHVHTAESGSCTFSIKHSVPGVGSKGPLLEKEGWMRVGGRAASPGEARERRV